MDNNLLSELDQYIKSAKTRLQTILTTLDWTVADSLKASTCSTRKEEEYFNRNDPPLPESFGCNNSVVIDENQLQSILQTTNVSIAKKFSDIQLNFTREQKCELYDHVIANTAKTSEPELKVSLPNDQTDNAMTFAEIVAKAKKKEKKLQRKYRTSKPTHIEEVRNLVSLQMQALDKYFNPETETKPDISRYKDHKVTYEERFHDYRRSRHRDHLKYVKRKSRSRSSDERSRNYHNRRRSDKREETTRRRSRSYDRNNRFSKRKSPSIERRKHSHERRKSKDDLHLLKKIKKEKSRSKSPKKSKSKDDVHLLKKIKKEKDRSKSPKKKKKHKHHRKH